MNKKNPKHRDLKSAAKSCDGISAKPRKMKESGYEQELARLQVELVSLQKWIKHERLRVLAMFEGRDVAGKGGTIKRIARVLNPRLCRTDALPRPTEREKTCWYFQRNEVTCRLLANRSAMSCRNNVFS